VNFAFAMIAGPVVNLTLRRFGTHVSLALGSEEASAPYVPMLSEAQVPMYCGNVLFAGGFIAASFATEFWHLVLTQGIMVG
jgi:hypothetical protein